MYEIHRELLWLGHAGDVREPGPLFDAGITAVVDLAFEEPPAQLPRELIYCRFPLNDGHGNEPSVLLHSVQTVVDFIGAGRRTLIGCSAGMSRSPTIAAFSLAAYLSQRPEDVVARIAGLKTLEINAGLWSDVSDVFSRVRR